MGAQDSVAGEAGAGVAQAARRFRAKPDGILNPAGEAGWFLQRERERRGESLEQTGAATGIHPYHVEAIEYGDLVRMPHRLEALEMIGVYAQYLGFDPQPLVRHYARVLPRPGAAQTRHPANPAPFSSAKILSFARLPRLPHIDFKLPGGPGGIVASLAAAIFLFAGTGFMLLPAADGPAAGSRTAETGDPMPTATTARKTAQIKITQEPLPDDQPQASDELAGTDLTGLAGLIEEGQPQAKIVARIASEEPPQANGTSRLTLKAKAPVWIRIEDSQGNVVITRMLAKGETYPVPDRRGLVVIARDGGLLSYMIDGKEKGILGSPGEILVGKSLDLGNLEEPG